MTQPGTLTIGAILLAGIVGGMIGGIVVDTRVGAQDQEVVTTTQVNVVDRDGRLRAVLSGQDERGTASLTFYDSNAQARSVVGVEQDGTPSLRLLTSRGQSRVLVLVDGEDGVVIVGDEAGRNGVFGSVGGSPVLNLGDAGVSRVRLQLGEGGEPSLGFYNANGQPGAVLLTDDTDDPFLMLYAGGRARVALGVTDETAVLNLSGPSQTRLVMGVGQDGFPSLTFLEEDGQIIQQLPAAEAAVER